MIRRLLAVPMLLLASLAFLPACSDSTGPSGPAVTGVILTAGSDSVVLGGSLQLVATVVGSGGTAVTGASVQWTSLVPGVASVNGAGVVTGVALGTVGIRAATGDYADTLFVRVRPVTCTAAQATTSFALETAVTGTLDASDCGFFGGVRAEGRSIVLTAQTTLRVRASSPNFAASVLISDAAMNIYAGGGAAAPGDDAEAFGSLPAGSYIVWVLGNSETQTGSWTFTATPVEFCTPATLEGNVVIGEAEAGAVSDDSCVLPNAIPGSGWGLTVASDTALRFAVASTDFDPVVIVTRTNAELDIVAVAFSNGAGEAILRTQFAAGEYIVWVMPYDGRYGSYTLAVDLTTLPSCTALDGTIALGEAVQGQLSDEDCSLGTRYADLWELTLATTTSVQIDQTSVAFDTYLQLRDATGATIAEDDDGGENLNSRIALTLPAGTYTVVATSFGIFSSGNYLLSAAAVSGDAASLRRVPAPRRAKPPARLTWTSPW